MMNMLKVSLESSKIVIFETSMLNFNFKGQVIIGKVIKKLNKTNFFLKNANLKSSPFTIHLGHFFSKTLFVIFVYVHRFSNVVTKLPQLHM